jgi:4-amino-4-deoxy-L-arabinose transferase-like glycosyltransferase
MLLILPLVAFLLFFLILCESGLDWRWAVLGAAVFWGTCIVLITETLSVPRLITRGPVAISWLAICIAAFLYLRVLKRWTRPATHDKQFSEESLERRTKGLLVGAGIIVVLVGITAVVCPPNVWDAMEYHLPRVTMWMSNHSVRFFATPNYAHLIFGPWAEYAMMHMYLLWGSDRFVNLIEFFSMLGCLVGVSLIAKMLGAGPRGQVLAVVTCATIPEGVLEASGPMNTYVASFWIMATVAFLISWNEDPSWLNTVCIGLSAGLATLTKGTAYVYLPFLVLACWWMGSTASRIRFVKQSAVFLLLILALNTPQYLRCYDLTGSPLGLPFPDAGPGLRWMVGRINAQGTLANVLRNISLHLALPGSAINARTERVVRSMIQGIGANPDDPRTLWPGDAFNMNHFSLHEIHAGNPPQIVLLLLSIGFVFWKRREGTSSRHAFWYALGIIAAFLLFCSLLRWQIWGSRHQLPLFVLGSALIGLVTERYFPQKLGTAVAVVLLAFALPFAVANRTRSLVPWSRVDDVYHPRAVLYFADEHEVIASANIAAADAVNQLNCNNIAVDSYTSQLASQINSSPMSFYVYPLFALIHAGRTPTVWYTGVHNWSSKYLDPESHRAPCAVICLDCARVPQKWGEYRGIGGRASVFGDAVIFSGVGQMPNTEAAWDHVITQAPIP